MARPPRERFVGGVPRVTLFKPAGVPARDLEELQLGVDELEALRLVDLEGLSHEQAASAMGVSRQTVGRVLERGRAKVAAALVGGKAILIGGGQYRVEPHQLRCAACGTRWVAEAEVSPDTVCPHCGAAEARICWGPGERCGGRGQGRRGGGQGRGRGCGERQGQGRGQGRGRGRHADDRRTGA